MKKFAWIIALIIFVIIVLIVVGRGRRTTEEPAVSTGPELVSDTDGENTVIVNDQDSGESVGIHLVILAAPGFVVIHEDAGGNLGQVIGVSDLRVGAQENVEIRLERPSVGGERLHAMLHGDNGDGVFEFPGSDTPLTDAAGDIIVAAFEINQPAAEPAAEKQQPSSAVLMITDNGFTPASLTIKAGQTVIWTNNSSNPAWPATAIHPTHTVYPGSGIGKCNTDDADQIFDACRGLGEGEIYSFIFEEIGTWRYHNHLNPGQTGTIIVE